MQKARIGGLATAAVMALTGGALAAPTAARAAEAAYFGVRTHGSYHDLVLKLTDPEKIAKARAILSGEEKNTTHLLGRIKKTPADYNPHYSFHVDPDTVSFFEVAIEVCDATLPYVEDHLDEVGGAFLPGAYFCPWSSQLTGEIKV
ncbi:BP74-related protein [Catenuloplanes indicus]|uniref:BP74 N-terminal domain-containing protein n=1 Tax=Catenuloplanes indicus TaxID=137267 RepID=A0AAE3W8L3_9ACTN|nr:hypothetical protein [Catenuloplanes indicus]MDQ0371471.1 hypothetical protein [Catenuloplanes indicus]